MRLTRNTTTDANPDLRGRKHYLTIENAPAIVLEAMDEMLEKAGWENDGCPCYDDGFGCGWWIDLSEIADFKAAYKEAKAGVRGYMTRRAIDAHFDTRVTDIEAAHAEALDIEAARQLTARQARFVFHNTAAERAEIIEAAHEEALALNVVFRKAKARYDHFWGAYSYWKRRELVEMAHEAALIEDATFEENLLFLTTPEMADVWDNHTDTLKARILAAAHAEALALDAEYGHPARFEYVNANGYKQTQLLAAAHEAALAMAANYASADQMVHEFLTEQAHADVLPMTATEAIRHMSSTLTRHMEQKLTEAQVITLRRMMTGTKYQLRGDGKKAHENRPSIEVKRGQWFRTIDPINAPSVPVLYRLGLVDFANNRGQEPTKYYNVRLTDKGLNALAPENDMTKAPEQHDPRSLNPMKEAVPASSAIHMRVTPDRKKRYVNQARAEGLKLTDWIQKHMDNVCNEAGQPDTTMNKEVVIIHGLGQKPGNGKCVPFEVPENSGLAKMKGKSDE